MLSKDKEVFKWKDLSIYQQDDVFKIGTDAILLGAWIPKVLTAFNRVLDVGTGTGILSLMMHHFFPNAEILSIDDNENAVHLANENFELANASGSIKVKNESLFNIKSESRSFDLIISNPPYFFEMLLSQKLPDRNAKHSGVSIDRWVESFYSLLIADGNICLVLPYDITNHWVKAANRFGLYVKNRMDVYSYKSDEAPVRSLIHLQSELVKPNYSHLHIYHTANQYTPEYIDFSGISPGKK